MSILVGDANPALAAGGSLDTTPPAAAATPALLMRLPLEHAPATHTAHAALFRGVTNAAHLHSQLLARNSAFEYALLDASAIAGTRQVEAAAFRALVTLLAGSLRTPNVHSETVFCLSPSNNVCNLFSHCYFSYTPNDEGGGEFGCVITGLAC